MSKKILVTGSAGFIGSEIARTLTERGHSVLGVDSLSKLRGGERAEVGSREFEFIELDLCEADLRAKIGGGWDEAYHLAATVGVEKVCSEPAETIRNNSISTIQFLDWARTSVNGRVLFASSCENYASFYGTGLIPIPTPEDVYLGIRDIYNPRWTYAATKILGELAFAHWGKEFVIVRYHNVYGPAMFSRHVIPELFSKIWQGMDPLLVASASQTRAFCHVRDAVAGTVAAMEGTDARGRVVNIGSLDVEIEIGELARRMARVSGRNIKVVAGSDVQGSVDRRRPDVTFMARLLGSHGFTALDAGLEECWAWQEAMSWVA